MLEEDGVPAPQRELQSAGRVRRPCGPVPDCGAAVRTRHDHEAAHAGAWQVDEEISDLELHEGAAAVLAREARLACTSNPRCFKNARRVHFAHMLQRQHHVWASQARKARSSRCWETIIG